MEEVCREEKKIFTRFLPLESISEKIAVFIFTPFWAVRRVRMSKNLW